jgi:proline racemase
VTAGEAIKKAVNATLSVQHPLEQDLSFLYGTILTGPPENPAHHSRNVCIFANAEVDRSPTGTGVSARLALHHAKGEITDDLLIVIESILGAVSAFGGQVVGQTQVGPHEAIVPEVSGTAFIIGHHTFLIDPQDELGRGFFLS